MFNHKHYVPILKGKRAEFPALGSLHSKDRITPLMEAVPSKPATQIPQGMAAQWPQDNASGGQRQPSPQKTYMQEFVVPLSDGSKAVFQWPSSLSQADADDITDSLKIVERKILRSVETTDVILPQCQCEGCSNKAHRSMPGRCTAKANATGTTFCTACETARRIDSDQFAQTQEG